MNEHAAAAGWKPYLRFLAQAAGIVAILVLVGYAPTRRWGGEEAVRSMLAASAISLLGSIAGTLPLVVARRRRSQQAAPRVLGATAVRLLVVLGAGILATVAGGLASQPLLLWLAVSYLALLVVDAAFARRALDPRRTPQTIRRTDEERTRTDR